MTSTEMEPVAASSSPTEANVDLKTYGDFYDACCDATFSTYIESPSADWLVEAMLADVTDVIRHRFGLGIQDVELLLADVRSDAYRNLERLNLDDFVKQDDLIKAIAEYLSEES